MDLKKFKDKKAMSAVITVLFTLLASFGMELGNDTQEFIRDILLGVFGGAATGAAAMKHQIKKKINENVLALDAGVKAIDGKIEALTAKATAEFGNGFGAFVEAELNPTKDELKALTGVEWKF